MCALHCNEMSDRRQFGGQAASSEVLRHVFRQAVCPSAQLFCMHMGAQAASISLWAEQTLKFPWWLARRLHALHHRAEQAQSPKNLKET